MKTIKLDGKKMTTEELTKYAEEYGIYIEEYSSEELVECNIINPENEQKIITAIIDSTDVDYHEAQKELTLTTQYHDWSGTVADRLYELLQNEELDTELVEQYNEAVSNYNQYGNANTIQANSTIAEAINTIQNNI